MDREKGVQSAPCPTCDTSRKAIAQDDGSVAFETCSKCYPNTEKAKKVPAGDLPVPPVGSESDARELGSEVTK